VLADPGAPGVSVLTDLGVTVDTGRAALRHLVGTGGLCESDAEALRTLGIDLDEVRRRVEASFGPGALDEIPRRRRRRRRWRRGRCEPALTGYLPFMPRAKRALERAAGEAATLGDGHIGMEHLLLGLLDPGGNMAVELLRHLGADPEVVRGRVLADLGQAA
jgi:ATP-dependent Clp protease ATP-binding subunit ClpA